jgi:prepilin-type N-terminal cleavage/methylation domain-containing protein
MKRMQAFKGRWGNHRGFTLIEVVAVLIILGIISAVAISRTMGTDEVKLQAEVDILKGHLRYAQYLALNDISPVKWGIQISGQSYTLVKNSSGDGATFDSPSPYILPNESSATHSIEPFTATQVTILFDEWGSPYSASTKLGSAFSIYLTPGSQSITITPETGFVP